MKCFGRNFDDHCCYINGKVCPILEENTEPGFRWTCSLARKYKGNWNAVIVDLEYAPIAELLKNTSYKNCRDYQCNECALLEAGTITKSEFESLKIANLPPGRI